jgi:hypothetical protein
MEKNKVYRLKDVFSQLVEGQRIVTNGDDITTQPEFFSGVITKKSDNELFIIRDDGEQGGGENNEWSVINNPDSIAEVIDFDITQTRNKVHRQLVFGDVIHRLTTLGVFVPAVVLQKLGQNKVYAKNFFETPGRSANAEVITIEGVVGVLIHLNHVPCANFGCASPAIRAVGGAAHCEEHLHERGPVVECRDCGTTIFESESFDIPAREGRGRLCAHCREERRNAARVIHDYSYKPVPNFITVDPVDHNLTTKIFEGLEQEVECPDNENNEEDEDDDDYEGEERGTPPIYGKKIIKRFLEPKKWFYLKHDGSIGNGFELVTHPASLSGHYSLPWKELCAYYKRLGIRADDTSTCGLHIHTNKDIMPPEHQIRLSYFVASNRGRMEAIARRPECSYAAFKRLDGSPSTLNRSSGKYEALNWNPPQTVEFRLFKGTVDYKTVMASIEFVHAAVTYTAGCSLDHLKLTRSVWPSFLKHVDDSKYKFLADYLKVRGVA